MNTWTDERGCHAYKDGWTCNLHPWTDVNGKKCVSMRVISPSREYINTDRSDYACTEEDAASALETGRSMLSD